MTANVKHKKKVRSAGNMNHTKSQLICHVTKINRTKKIPLMRDERIKTRWQLKRQKRKTEKESTTQQAKSRKMLTHKIHRINSAE